MSRGFQGARPSLYDFENEIRKLTTPALIVVGDEDERCIEPGLFLKDVLVASGLVILPKTGHVVNLEEPDLFNARGRRFPCARRRRSLAARDPRTRAAEALAGVMELGDGCTLIDRVAERRGALPMLKWAFVFLIIAIVAGIFGFSDIEAMPPPPSRNGCSASS